MAMPGLLWAGKTSKGPVSELAWLLRTEQELLASEAVDHAGDTEN